MKGIHVFFLSLFFITAQAQSVHNLLLKGSYSSVDSANVTRAYLNAILGVEQMNNAMNDIWSVDKSSEKSKDEQRKAKWKADPYFMTWLGEPSHMGKAQRKIKKIHSKFRSDFILEVVKDDVGKCGRFVSAWAVPYGKVKIRLCRNFINFGPRNQEKTIIHEIAHEAGLLFDRGVYRCASAKSVAANTKKNRAARRPENYAWLAMSYLGVECTSNRYVSPRSY
jgi:hypothetical protein